MVLPGWNVSEPLQAAWKFYSFVRDYKDADDQIKRFALEVETFRTTLKALDACLENPNAAPLDDSDPLKVASDGCKDCAENCQNFVNNFFREFDAKRANAPARDGVGPVDRLNWMWKKGTAANLASEIHQQVNYINLHLNIAERQVSLQSPVACFIADRD